MTSAGAILLCLSFAVVDGDTGKCATAAGPERIRIHALHAPEADQRRGPAATAELIRLTAGRRVTCTVAATDRYGRAVADCATAEGDLAAAMIAAGVARWCPAFGRADLAGTPTNRLRLPGYCRD